MPIKVFEVGKVSNRAFAQMWKMEDWGFNNWLDQVSIVNYGSDRDITKRERVITNSIAFRNFDRNRITLVRGGYGTGPKTVVWRVPDGADNPKP